MSIHGDIASRLLVDSLMRSGVLKLSTTEDTEDTEENPVSTLRVLRGGEFGASSLTSRRGEGLNLRRRPARKPSEQQ